jgi:hypothetical protein
MPSSSPARSRWRARPALGSTRGRCCETSAATTRSHRGIGPHRGRHAAR